MKAFTSYSTTLFEHGSPFMGDNMDPLIQGNQEVKSMVIATDDFQRNQIFTINMTETPYIDNLEFFDWQEDGYPL